MTNRRDQYHAQAVALAEKFREHPLLITDGILLEIGNALARDFRQEGIAAIETFLHSSEVEVVHLSPRLFSRAFALYKSRQDKAWSLVDCISFIVMEDKGVRQALSFDQHFVQAGFEPLMRESGAG